MEFIMKKVQNLVSDLVDKARFSQSKISNYSQDEIDSVCLSAGWQLYKYENIVQCARIAVDETGMGIYEDKIKKHGIYS